MGLKTLIRSYRLKASEDSNLKKGSYSGFDRSKSIAICYELKNRSQIQTYADSLVKLGKQVHLLEYIPLKKKEIEKQSLKLPTTWFCKSDGNWLDIPRNEHVDKFLSVKNDIYMEFVEENNLMIEFITKVVKSDFKVGSYDSSSTNFDLNISAKSNGLKEIFKQINYYLNFINQ